MIDGGIYIIEDLGLDFLNVDKSLINSINYSNRNGQSYVYISFKKIPTPCPHCGNASTKTNGTQTVSVNHPFFVDRECTVYLKKFRYVCSICKRTYMLSNELAAPRARISKSVAPSVMELAKDEHIPFSFIASQLHISLTTVISIFNKTVTLPPQKLPYALCIDEVYLGRKSRRKYAVVLLDFVTNTIIDFIDGRSISDCVRALDMYSREERNSVQYLSTDMYQGFIQLSKTMFPKAKICVDGFHVISLILNEFDQVFRTIMNQFGRDTNEYYLLKRQRHLLMRNESSIEWYPTLSRES